MTDKNIRVILTLLVFCLTSGPAVCRAVMPGSGAEKAFTGNPPPAAGGSKVSIPARPEVQYKAEGLKDPFRGVEQKTVSSEGVAHAAPQSKPLPPLTVTGLIWGGAFPQAIVNNKIVRIGDMVAPEVKVVDITKEGVVVFFDYKNYSLPPPAIVTKSQGSGSAK